MTIIYANAMNYENAAKNAESFYYMQNDRSAERPVDQGSRNELLLMGLPQGWNTFSDEHWTYVMSGKTTFPDQGWKIHISAVTKELQFVLQDVADFLIDSEISFKFVPSVEEWIAKNSKYADRAYSGKFITIYPSSTEQFIWLLDKLKQITDKYSLGPYILNDKAWKQSNVYFRYGGLKRMYSEKDGQEKSVIYTPDGKAIEDLRVPYYVLPDFVTEPDEVAKNNRDDKLSEDSPIRQYPVVEALHFSNAGGVYRTSVKKGNYILKEGRREAGIDAAGRDGFSRVSNEYRVLSHLASVNHVVKPVDFFVAWRQAYLVEEFVEGKTLQQVVASEYPFSQTFNLSENANAYANKMLTAAHILRETLQNIHACGVALCDISPQNILLDDAGIPTIIDCEAGAPLRARFIPALATHGFMLSSATTFEEQDWYAYRQIVRMMFHPTAPVHELAPSIEKWQDRTIEEKFGTDVLKQVTELTNTAELFTRGTNLAPIPHPLFPLSSELSLKVVTSTQQAIFNGMVSSWNESTSSFPGDVTSDQYAYGRENFAVGNAGVLTAAARYIKNNRAMVSSDQQLELNRSIQKFLSETDDPVKKDYGLFSGLTGIKLAQYELGKKSAFSELSDVITHDKAWLEATDISLFSGISGLALSLLAQSELTANDYQNILELAVLRVKELWTLAKSGGSTSKKNNNTPQGADILDFSLITGWAGAALFTWKYALFGCDAGIRKVARNLTLEIVREMVSSLTLESDNYYAIDTTKGFERSVSYLESGTAGITLLLLELLKDDETALPDDIVSKLPGLLRSCLPSLSYNGSLFSGMAGFLPAVKAGVELNVLGENELNSLLRSLSSYLLRNDSEILVPGWYGYKCSSDYMTGAAGVLLALHSVTEQDGWGSWFPIQSSKLKLFEK